MKQTFLIEINEIGDKEYDFFRVGCKRKETALKYLKNWVNEAKSRHLEYLYSCFFVEGATYRIVETPDGYNKGGIVLSGFCADLIK